MAALNGQCTSSIYGGSNEDCDMAALNGQCTSSICGGSNEDCDMAALNGQCTSSIYGGSNDDFLQQWAEWDQTPIDIDTRHKRALETQTKSSIGSVNAHAQEFPELFIGDNLSLMFQKLDNSDNNDELCMNYKLNNTKARDDHAESATEQQLFFMKQLAYHSVAHEARLRRNNLIFYGLADTIDENTYDLLREFLSDYFDVELEGLYVHRVRRLGSFNKKRSYSQTPRRPIIASFRDYGDTEIIMKKAHRLSGTRYGIDRDYPLEISQARKKLCEYKKSHYSASDKVQILFPAKLMVNGKVVADEFPEWHTLLNMNRLAKFKGPWQNAKHDSDSDPEMPNDNNTNTCLLTNQLNPEGQSSNGDFRSPGTHSSANGRNINNLNFSQKGASNQTGLNLNRSVVNIHADDIPQQEISRM